MARGTATPGDENGLADVTGWWVLSPFSGYVFSTTSEYFQKNSHGIT
jgi:hypothetical protein